jgi:hypothetical protein
VDYSLLIQISKNSNQFSAGIIDYSQQYTLTKAVEKQYKQVVMNTEDTTIINPIDYRQRFRKKITEEFFLGISV